MTELSAWAAEATHPLSVNGLIVHDALDKLIAEGSPAQIAARLEREGIRGRPHCPMLCVLADWLQRQLPPNASVVVGGIGVFIRTTAGTTVVSDWLPQPAVVDEFRSNFDQGLYPQLIDRRPAAIDAFGED